MAYLPNEVWLEVATYLTAPIRLSDSNDLATYDNSRRVLRQLCLASRQFPLTERPDLGKEVRHLRIDKYCDTNNISRYYMDMEDYAELPLDPTVSRLFVNDLKHFKGYERLGSRFKKFWEKHLSYGVGSAEVALLLALTSNLRSLDIQPSKTRLTAFVQKLCDSMLGPQHWMIRADQGRFWNDPVDYHSHLICAPFENFATLRLNKVFSFTRTHRTCMKFSQAVSSMPRHERTLPDACGLAVFCSRTESISFPHLNTLTSSQYEYDDCLEEMLYDRYHGYGDEDIDSFERAERLDVELTVEYELYPCEIDSDEDH
ncbi:hypothetical protein E4T42_05896 [Aureobasidium subglaciale]|nr:hypothetical protein E4T42_05896 [Aureobasidium subglaciale]